MVLADSLTKSIVLHELQLFCVYCLFGSSYVHKGRGHHGNHFASGNSAHVVWANLAPRVHALVLAVLDFATAMCCVLMTSELSS